MRSAVDALLKWHASIESPDLLRKLDKLSNSPFRFFRGMFFLYCADLRKARFAELFSSGIDTAGPIIGDIHTENFGSFRAVTGEIVYDVNDFDETTTNRYVVDAGRLAASLILAALDNGSSFSRGVAVAEITLREWVATLSRCRKLKRPDFCLLPETKQVKELLATVAEKSRAEFMKKIAQESTPGNFVFRLSEDYRPASDDERAAVEKALPDFLRTCLAPKSAKPRTYHLLDVAARVAGNGSLGRKRLAILLGKSRTVDDFSSLRLIEWKQSLDSALDAPKPSASRTRSREIFEATRNFQLYPKRYLGWTVLSGMPVQAREIGANDARFNIKVFGDPVRFDQAARSFGFVLARCHLLSCSSNEGARTLPAALAGTEDRLIHSILRFAVNYASQTVEDYEELKARQAEVEKRWTKQSRPTLPIPPRQGRRSRRSS